MVAPVHARKSQPVIAIAIVVACIGVSPVVGTAHWQAPDDRYSSEIEAIRLLQEKGHYRTAAERSRFLLSRVEQDSEASPMVRGSALDVLVESLLLVETSNEERLALAIRAVDTKAGAIGPDDKESAYSRMNLAGVLAKSGQFTKARDLLEGAVEVFEPTLGANHAWTARALTALTRIVYLMGDLKAAREYGGRAVSAAEAAFGAEGTGVAKALTNLAGVHGGAGDIRTAIQLEERAVAILRRAHKGDHPQIALILGNLAFNRDRTNEFAKSDALHQESVAMYERTVGPDAVDLAWELNNYGLLFWRLGDFETGRPMFERALAIWTKADSLDASRALNNLAITHRRMGDFSAARRYYDRSLAIKEKTLGPDHQEVALVLFNTANLLNSMGNYTAAQPMYERALRIREARLGLHHTLTAYTLNGLGEVLNKQNEQARAKAPVERAVNIWRKLKAPEVAIGLSTLAAISLETGNLAAALSYYDDARAIYLDTFGPDYIDVAVLLNKSAAVLTRRGEFEAARHRYARALEMLERQFDANHPDIADVTAGLARVHWQLGNTAEALAFALRSDRISREHFRLTSRTLSEREAVSFSDTRAPALDVLLTLAASGELGPDGNRQTMDAAIRSRALVLDEMSQRSRFTVAGGTSPETVALIGVVSHARQRLANLIVRGPRPRETGYPALLANARNDREAAERQLAAAGLGGREQLAREHAGLSEVAAALPADTVLVTFIAYDHLSRHTVSANERRYMALILRGSAPQVAVLPLGTVGAVDARVELWRKAVAAASVPGAASERMYRRVAGALSDAIWRPIAPYVRDARQLLLVPDGALNLVSFAALPEAQGTYLIENATLIHYLSAERDVVTASVGRAPTGGLLAVGNPVYGSLSSRKLSGGSETELRGVLGCPEFQRVRFERLPATDREVQDVVGLWNAHVGAGVEQLSGARATETAFKQAAARNRILHLATHGFFLGSCGPSPAGTRALGGIIGKLPAAAAAHQNALALSGLALAGANQRASAGREQDDGILTAEEVAGLDLQGVEWAVLSACDTGVGEVRAGEGVFGLRRAFATAGAWTTIMSLWSVDDQSTRQWMAALYRARLVERRSTAEAVTDASRALLRARRARGATTHPFYWAAFVAAGDWR
jgi:CHAT domain-containing protein/tetratricopeptide (TPR) repeat protein